MIEIKSAAQLSAMCGHIKEEFHQQFDEIEFPLYCAIVPAYKDRGREREIIRKQRMSWCRGKIDTSRCEAYRFAFWNMHFDGHFLFRDLAIALAFQITFQ